MIMLNKSNLNFIKTIISPINIQGIIIKIAVNTFDCTILYGFNGKLFKMLNDLEEKQEGVPFNISIGGGTQGLSEVVYLNYMKLPEYVLPLEKEFGGSFIGWLKSFKFYNCLLNYQEILGNYNFTKII